MAVYVSARQDNHDTSSAEVEYGDLNYLFPMGISVIDPDLLLDEARKWVSDFDFDEDYFIPVGPPLLIAIASMALVDEANNQEAETITFLEWDRRAQKYNQKVMYL